MQMFMNNKFVTVHEEDKLKLTKTIPYLNCQNLYITHSFDSTLSDHCI